MLNRSGLIRLIVLFLALWLPVQSTAGLASPFCKHMLQQNAAAPAAHDYAGHQHNSDVTGIATLSGHGAGCDDCGLCDLACAVFLPASRAAPTPAGALAPASVLVQYLKSFSPQQLQRPPLASA